MQLVIGSTVLGFRKGFGGRPAVESPKGHSDNHQRKIFTRGERLRRRSAKLAQGTSAFGTVALLASLALSVSGCTNTMLKRITKLTGSSGISDGFDAGDDVSFLTVARVIRSNTSPST